MARQSCFRWTVLTLLLLGTAITQEAGAKPRDLSQYPLRVHIFQSHWDRRSGDFYGQGYGIANLFDGATVRGMNFTYDCPAQYAETIGNEAYVAKWKKPEKTLELVAEKTGEPGKSDTCEFRVTLHDFVYDLQNGTLATFSPEQYKMRLGAALPKNESIDTNPSHYPLRLAVLQAHWEPAVNGTRNGSGRGNLRIGSKLSSVDFTTSCGAAFPTTPDDRYYAAIWIREGAELAVLLTQQGGAAICRLDTILHTDVYVREASGTVKAISQDDYKIQSSQ